MTTEVNKVKIQLVSDIHLGSDSEPNFLLFKSYLQSVVKNKVTHLFLLGDIFDLWVANHKYFIDQYSAIVEEIKKIVDAGVEVHYFEGNHDLHLKKYWQGVVGCYVYDSPQRMNIAGLNLLLAHGDEVDKEDINYIRLRRFFRCLPMKIIAYCLPGFIVNKIGKAAGDKSHGHYLRENKDNSRIIKLIRDYAELEHSKLVFDFCFTGHFHLRDEFNIGKSKAINLGTWLEKPGFYEVTNSESKFYDFSK